MLALSRKTDYALVALAELALHQPEGVSSHALAEATHAPEAMLRNVLKDLCRSGLLASERGPFGGYTLTADPAEVTVLDVIEAIEGPVSMTRCCSLTSQPQSEECHHTQHCRIRDAIRSMHDEVTGILHRTTLADLLSHQRSPNPPSSDPQALTVRLRDGGKPGHGSIETETPTPSAIHTTT
ncbi:MAG: RrF2 family transcriptional regulator [Phycisphaeraceae bacterium]